MTADKPEPITDDKLLALLEKAMRDSLDHPMPYDPDLIPASESFRGLFDFPCRETSTCVAGESDK
ncbi:hypothetical protein [Bifidobacterium sp. SO1]|uniref:hypothetical protein n=1 Tax=Bifidobacterium sp. SO1 TaxID=2809029 RepID=UPI001BDDB2F2|nr:hypothetical protein [Bifidobacterium sp. SO1]MBT1162974.1 hypothetical protein [Bifidobacterium sp. SO1]